jgi:hypothetical protein
MGVIDIAHVIEAIIVQKGGVCNFEGVRGNFTTGPASDAGPTSNVW